MFEEFHCVSAPIIYYFTKILYLSDRFDGMQKRTTSCEPCGNLH